jgi:hypothetical protein
MNRFFVIVVCALVLILSACGSPTVTGPTNQASFDVTGTWKGTATDTDSNFNVTLVLDNNGGSDSFSLKGTLTLEGVGSFPFSNSFIPSIPGQVRTANIQGSDSKGFAFQLLADFTSQRVDDATLTSSNPDFDIDNTLLSVDLVKQ